MTSKFSFQRCIDLVFRYKWYIIAPSILGMLAGVALSLNVPKMFKTSTVILVEPKKVPDNYVKSTISLDLSQQLNSITPQVMSRPNLLKVIEKFNLHDGKEDPLHIDSLIKKLQRSVKISVKGKNSFSITCNGRDPEIVMKITNMLSDLFIQENLSIRAKQASQTADFLYAELEEIKLELERQETALSRFKRTYMGELPEQKETNLRVLDRLQLQLQTNDSALRIELDRKSLLEQQLNIVISSSSGTGSAGLGIQLRDLREKLTSLKAIYTEKHPDVISTEIEIKSLEKKFNEQRDELDDTARRELTGDPQYRELVNQINTRALEIKALRDEQNQLKEQIVLYQRRVDIAPKREQELLLLTRDYQNTRENYMSLMNKKLEADLSENLEIKQQGEQFRILDPAVKPVRPFSPKKPLYAAVGFIIGLLIGGTVIVVKEFFDHSFHNADELAEYIEFPVLISIPQIITEEDLKRQKVKRAVVISTSFIIFVAMAAVFVKFIFLAE